MSTYSSGVSHIAQRIVDGVRQDRRRTPLPSTSQKIRGYAALFNVVSAVGGDDASRLLIKPGAFDLSGSNVRLCRDHLLSKSYASTRDGTLRVWQDNRGLAFEAQIDGRSTDGSCLLHVISSGTRGMSAYMDDGWESELCSVAGEKVHVVSRTKVIELSVLKRPAIPGSLCWIE